MILILSNKQDICVDYVVKLLRNRNLDYLRLNTEDLTKKDCSVNLPKFSYFFSVNGDDIAKRLKSVWFRRPGVPSTWLREPVRRYVAEQWRSFINGLLAIRGVLWVNDPFRNEVAESKILQLHTASLLDFRIPRTCITSSKREAIRFYRELSGNVIAKALNSPLLEYKRRDFFIFTTRMPSLERIQNNELSLAPTIFQEELQDKTDLRVTVIGPHVYCARIESQNGAQIPLDWRLKKQGMKFVQTELPHEIRTKCLALTKQFGLVFAAIDLAVVRGRYYFLEVNPNGEWGWLQRNARLPIAESLVSVLARGVQK